MATEPRMDFNSTLYKAVKSKYTFANQVYLTCLRYLFIFEMTTGICVCSGYAWCEQTRIRSTACTCNGFKRKNWEKRKCELESNMSVTTDEWKKWEMTTRGKRDRAETKRMSQSWESEKDGNVCVCVGVGGKISEAISECPSMSEDSCPLQAILSISTGKKKNLACMCTPVLTCLLIRCHDTSIPRFSIFCW